MPNISDSFLNQKRVKLITQLCGEQSAKDLQNAFKSAFDSTLSNIDEKTMSLLNFITRLDKIHELEDNNKQVYNVGNRNVKVVKTQGDLDAAVLNLMNAKVVGFDTEQKPIFKKGVSPSKISIIQLSDGYNSYIFQVQQINNITPLLDILASPDITKVGIGLRGDSTSLFNEFNITLKSCIDFGAIFKSKLFYANELGAKKSVLFFLNKRLQKSGKSSRSNWETPKLSDSQIRYASEDASCVYDVFCTMLIENPYLIDILPPWFKTKYDGNEFQIIFQDFQN